MGLGTIRTNTHFYPAEEIKEMDLFYNGKRCVLERRMHGTVYAHMLSATLPASKERLEEMLQRNLRVDKHPHHAAEVRENVLPLADYFNKSIEASPPRSTLFLHEDDLARTLSYERDLLKWRIGELRAGRDDPGRPSYEEVFGGMRITRHRYHAASNHERFTRYGNHRGGDRAYDYTACLGIDDSPDQFPIIDTLLSIPFSLIHCLPRLVSLLPRTLYRQQLITMAYEVIMLWWWEPPSTLREESMRIRSAWSTNRPKLQPKSRPNPIHLRHKDTFATTKPNIMLGNSTARSSGSAPHQLAPFVDLPSGKVVLGTMLSVSLNLDRDGLLTVADEGSGDPTITDKGSVTSLRSTMDRDAQSAEPLTDDSDAIDEVTEASNVDGKFKNHMPSFDVMSWYGNVFGGAPEPLLPLTPTPLERGNLGGQSVNDVLMIRGLIRPPVYLQFFDLSSFTFL